VPIFVRGRADSIEPRRGFGRRGQEPILTALAGSGEREGRAPPSWRGAAQPRDPHQEFVKSWDQGGYGIGILGL
jgi:hypothetical protein